MPKMHTEIYLTAPTRPLTMNRGPHGVAASRLIKTWRNAAYNAAVEQAPTIGFTDPVFCVVLLSFPDRRRRDPHNWLPSLKPCIDGFVDAGNLADDRAEMFTGPLPILDEPNRHGQLELTFLLSDEVDVVSLVRGGPEQHRTLVLPETEGTLW